MGPWRPPVGELPPPPPPPGGGETWNMPHVPWDAPPPPFGCWHPLPGGPECFAPPLPPGGPHGAWVPHGMPPPWAHYGHGPWGPPPPPWMRPPESSPPPPPGAVPPHSALPAFPSSPEHPGGRP